MNGTDMVNIAFAGQRKRNNSKIGITTIPMGDMHSSGSNKRIKAVLSAAYLTSCIISSGWTHAGKSNIVIDVPTAAVCKMNDLSGIDGYYVEAACRITHGVSQSPRVRSGEISARTFCDFVVKNVSKNHDEIHIKNSDKVSNDSIRAIEYLLLGDKQKSLVLAVKDLLSSDDFVRIILCILESFELDKPGSFIRIDEGLDSELKDALDKDERYPGWCSIRDAFDVFDGFLKLNSAQVVLNKVLRSIIDKKTIEGVAIRKNLSKNDDVLSRVMRFAVFINAVTKSLSDDETMDGYSMSISSDTIREMVGMNRAVVGRQGLMVFSHDAESLANRIVAHYGDIVERKDEALFSVIKMKNLVIMYSSFNDPSVLSVKSKAMLKAMGSIPYRCILDTDPLSDADMKDALDCIQDGLYLRGPDEMLVYDDDVRNTDTRTIFESKIGTIIPHWFDADMDELSDMIRSEAVGGINASVARSL